MAISRLGQIQFNGLVESPRQPGGQRTGEGAPDGQDPGAEEQDAPPPVNESNDPSKRLNTQQRVFLRLLLSIEEAELNRGEAIRLVERVSDFIDADRTPRLDGAESEVYLTSAFPYRPPNRPLASVSELRAVDGITPELYTLIAPYLTVWPVEGSKVNILTAPPQLLAALAGDDAFEPLASQEVARIVELRSEGMITDVDTYLSDALFTNSTTTELREMIDVKSDWFLLDARSTLPTARDGYMRSSQARSGGIRSAPYRGSCNGPLQFRVTPVVKCAVINRPNAFWDRARFLVGTPHSAHTKLRRSLTLHPRPALWAA